MSVCRCLLLCKLLLRATIKNGWHFLKKIDEKENSRSIFQQIIRRLFLKTKLKIDSTNLSTYLSNKFSCFSKKLRFVETISVRVILNGWNCFWRRFFISILLYIHKTIMDNNLWILKKLYGKKNRCMKITIKITGNAPSESIQPRCDPARYFKNGS